MMISYHRDIPGQGQPINFDTPLSSYGRTGQDAYVNISAVYSRPDMWAEPKAEDTIRWSLQNGVSEAWTYRWGNFISPLTIKSSFRTSLLKSISYKKRSKSFVHLSLVLCISSAYFHLTLLQNDKQLNLCSWKFRTPPTASSPPTSPNCYSQLSPTF